jgi:hypothetical protein
MTTFAYCQPSPTWLSTFICCQSYIFLLRPWDKSVGWMMCVFPFTCELFDPYVRYKFCMTHPLHLFVIMVWHIILKNHATYTDLQQRPRGIDCLLGLYGCCPDSLTVALGPRMAGCDVPHLVGCMRRCHPLGKVGWDHTSKQNKMFY